jgi:hypothetical protein
MATKRRRTRRNNKSRRNNKTFKQKIYNMKGCSKSRQRNSRRGLSGGKLSGGSSHLIGEPWSFNQTSLSNYYANNLYDGKDVQTQMQLNGGKRRKLSRRKLLKQRLKGGGLSDFLPSDITNLGNDIMYNSNSAYNSLTGADAAVNPSPHQGHLTASLNANRIII